MCAALPALVAQQRPACLPACEHVGPVFVAPGEPDSGVLVVVAHLRLVVCGWGGGFQLQGCVPGFGAAWCFSAFAVGRFCLPAVFRVPSDDMY